MVSPQNTNDSAEAAKQPQLAKALFDFRHKALSLPEFWQESIFPLMEPDGNLPYPRFWNRFDEILKSFGDFRNFGWVYIFWDAHHKCGYIGTTTNIGKRIWDHFMTKAEYDPLINQGESEKHIAFGKLFTVDRVEGHVAHFVTLIPFDVAHKHFALALEAYLIEKLKPEWNTRGISAK